MRVSRQNVKFAGGVTGLLLVAVLAGAGFVAYKRSNTAPVHVYGTVVDIQTHEALPGARVLAMCWWSRLPGEVGLKEYDTQTDGSGNYSLRMDVCKYIVVAADTDDHQWQRRISRADHEVYEDFQLLVGPDAPGSLFDAATAPEVTRFVAARMRE